jgi:hypothetical protein
MDSTNSKNPAQTQMTHPFQINVGENWKDVPRYEIGDGIFKIVTNYVKGATVSISICDDGKIIIDCGKDVSISMCPA